MSEERHLPSSAIRRQVDSLFGIAPDKARGRDDAVRPPDTHTLPQGDVVRRGADPERTVQMAREAAAEFSERLARVVDIEDLSGQVFGSFRVERMIGRGGMGVVALAVETSTGRKVALKLIPHDDQFAFTLDSDAYALGEIDHQNVVEVLSRGRTGRFLWVAMRYVDGRSLEAIIHERAAVPQPSFHEDFADDPPPSIAKPSADPGPVQEPPPRAFADLRLAMRWFRDCARALKAIHARDIVHRDIKPANIMIAWTDDFPYVIDFGLSSVTGDWVADEFAGTVPYMSPEQASRNLDLLNGKSDVYSLAVTFQELITGRSVARASSRSRVIAEILFKQVPRPSSINPAIPAEIDAIFLRATAKDPEDRWDAAELAAALDLWLESTPTKRFSSEEAPPRRSVPRRTFILAGLLLAVAVAAAFLLLRDPVDEVLRKAADLEREHRGVDALNVMLDAAPSCGKDGRFIDRYRALAAAFAPEITDDLLSSLFPCCRRRRPTASSRACPFGTRSRSSRSQ